MRIFCNFAETRQYGKATMARKKDPLAGAAEQGTTIDDFIIPQKVKAFLDAYKNEEDEKLATIIFDEKKLREFFKAYPCSLGDPLKGYLDCLEMAGFRMQVCTAGEPAIFVSEKAIRSIFTQLEEK